MRSKLEILRVIVPLILLTFMTVEAAAQSIDELRTEVESMGSFEFEDLMSNNAQTLRFRDECTLELLLVVNWQDGGEWTTKYQIPLTEIRLDGVMIRQRNIEEPPGLFLETFDERIEVQEEQEGVTRRFKQYQVFIRTDDDNKAVLLTAYLRRIIASCNN